MGHKKLIQRDEPDHRSWQILRELCPDMPGICYYVVGDHKAGASYAGSFMKFLDPPDLGLHYQTATASARHTVSVPVKNAPKPKAEPIVAVTADDIWLSDYLPGQIGIAATAPANVSGT